MMVETNTIVLTTTISSGASLSSAIDLSAFALNKDSYRLFGIQTPSALTGTSLGVQVSVDGGVTYKTMYDITGSAISIEMGADRYIQLDPSVFSAVSNLKLLSNGTESATRTFTLVLRNV